jgi:hypothetical protein
LKALVKLLLQYAVSSRNFFRKPIERISMPDTIGSEENTELSGEVDRQISDSEVFSRIIKCPWHFKDVPTLQLKQSNLFMPSTEELDGEQIAGGVSLDRLLYCSPARSKGMALSNFGLGPDGQMVYRGIAFLTLESIKQVNLLTIKELCISRVKTESDFDRFFISSQAELSKLLPTFTINLSPVYPYCIVLATPMNDGKPVERIGPATKVYVTDAGNPAHAEIFYMFKLAKPGEPNSIFIQEVARRLTLAAIKKFDTTEDLSQAPSFP